MNKEEFLELQDETALYFYNVAKLNKELYIANLRFNYTFYDILREKIDIENEINYIKVMIELKNKNLDYEKASKDFINQMVDRNLKIEKEHENVLLVHDKIVNKTEEELKEIEDYFLKFNKDYHPIIWNTRTNDAAMAYNFVEKMYRENNLGGMKEAFELNKTSLSRSFIRPEEYSKVAMIYYNSKKKIIDDYAKKLNRPNQKQIIEGFKSEDNKVKLEEELKKDTENMLKAQASLEQDFKNNFGYELDFTNLF